MVSATIVSMADNDKKTIVTLNSFANINRQCLFEQAHAMMIEHTYAISYTGAT
jgi:hypothetical protein